MTFATRMHTDKDQSAMAEPLEPRIRAPRMQYCTRCVYPLSAATPLVFDKDGVCSGCGTHGEIAHLRMLRLEIGQVLVLVTCLRDDRRFSKAVELRSRHHSKLHKVLM